MAGKRARINRRKQALAGSADGAVDTTGNKIDLSEEIDPITENQNNSGGLDQGIKADKIIRDPPEISEERKALVARWEEKIKADKEHHKDAFKRMREDMTLNRLGADKDWVDAGKYTVPIINRKINTDVAALYAKNPKCAAKKRKRLNFKLWDGTNQSAQAAFQAAELGDPTAKAIVAEIQEFQAISVMLTRMGTTIEVLFDYYTNTGTPTFKKNMKRLVRRAKTCGVGYIDLGYQRIFDPESEAVMQRIDDVTQQIALIESKLADVEDEIIQEGNPELEQLRVNLKTLSEQETIIIKEGPVFNFPGSTKIIPHKKCYNLAGFQGADHLAEEFNMTPEIIQAVYKVDIKSASLSQLKGGATLGVDSVDPDENRKVITEEPGYSKKDHAPKSTVRVWRIQDKKNRQVLTICEGYPDFLKEPAAPECEVNGFWTTFALTFNDVEDEQEIFPLSDVHYMKDPQKEFNTARQGLREHRKANRPKYFTRKGVLTDEEKEKLEDAQANAIIELKGMDAKTAIDTLIAPYKPVPIDPNLYSTTQIIQDVLYGVGSQSADMGNTNDASATQSSISENSRMSTLSSNVDDLDSLLSEVVDAMGQVMLAELTPQTVQEIAGIGAVWPQLNRKQISRELYLDVKAGSSGKPNEAMELAKMERGMPYLIQIGGINPAVLAKKYGNLLDLDMEELEAVGMPSIVAMNAIAAMQAKMAEQAAAAGATPGGGGVPPQVQPQAPGAPQPQTNQPKPAANEAGPQPAFPAAVHHYDKEGKRI